MQRVSISPRFLSSFDLRTNVVTFKIRTKTIARTRGNEEILFKGSRFEKFIPFNDIFNDVSIFLLYLLTYKRTFKIVTFKIGTKRKQLFECSKETGTFLKKYLLFIEYRNIESIHCFPLLNVIKSHENLMLRIGHDFAVADFESAGQFLNNVSTVGHYAAH